MKFIPQSTVSVVQVAASRKSSAKRSVSEAGNI